MALCLAPYILNQTVSFCIVIFSSSNSTANLVNSSEYQSRTPRIMWFSWSCSCQWGETTCLSYGYQLSYFSSPRWYTSIKSRWNDTDRKKTKNSGKTSQRANLSTTNLTWTDAGRNPSLRGEKLATNCLSHSIAFSWLYALLTQGLLVWIPLQMFMYAEFLLYWPAMAELCDTLFLHV
jgi:hypothetical protein